MQKAIKRVFDILFSAIALVALVPLFVVIGLWVAVSSPGGVFFRQKRTGYRGRDFDLLKFRSMKVNEHADTLQCVDDDPRVTVPGRLLRLTSLDELPQLWNVLRGDMSLIGPRPHMLAHTEYYGARIPHYMHRHDMRPGLTGLAQVRGQRGPTEQLADMQARVASDLEYVDHFSLWLDIKIFARTLWRILTFHL